MTGACSSLRQKQEAESDVKNAAFAKSAASRCLTHRMISVEIAALVNGNTKIATKLKPL